MAEPDLSDREKRDPVYGIGEKLLRRVSWGIGALPDEDWPAYQVRVLSAERDSPLADWLLSALWLGRDNTPEGAAMRLMYVLDYGVPGDWEAIIHGQAESDYLRNGFLWDRIGMMRPQRG